MPVESSSMPQGSQPIGDAKKTAEMEFVRKAERSGDFLDFRVVNEEQLLLAPV